MTKLTDKTEITTTSGDDFAHVVDVSDTGSDPAGSSKKVTLANMFKSRLTDAHSIVLMIDSKNTSSQTPAGEGIANAITVAYGATETASDSGIKIYSTGEVEILDNSFEYQIEFSSCVSRSSAAGTDPECYMWTETALDGVTYAINANYTAHFVLPDDASVTTPRQTATLPRGLPVGTKFKVMFARSAVGLDQGFLCVHVPTGDFSALATVPSARMVIKKVLGV